MRIVVGSWELWRYVGLLEVGGNCGRYMGIVRGRW